AAAPLRARVLLEQLDQLVGHGAGQLARIGDGDRAAVVAGHVVTDADGDQLDWRTGLDLVDDLTQVLLQVAAGIHRKGRVVDRRAVGDHYKNAALLGPGQQTPVGPGERL